MKDDKIKCWTEGLFGLFKLNKSIFFKKCLIVISAVLLVLLFFYSHTWGYHSQLTCSWSGCDILSMIVCRVYGELLLFVRFHRDHFSSWLTKLALIFTVSSSYNNPGRLVYVFTFGLTVKLAMIYIKFFTENLKGL